MIVFLPQEDRIIYKLKKKTSRVGYELTSVTQHFGPGMMTGPGLCYAALKNLNNGQ